MRRDSLGLAYLGVSDIVDDGERPSLCGTDTPVELARRSGVPRLVLECQARESIVRERLDKRAREGRAVSDGRWEIYHSKAASLEPPVERPPGCHVVLDRSHPVEEPMAAPTELMRALRRGSSAPALGER